MDGSASPLATGSAPRTPDDRLRRLEMLARALARSGSLRDVAQVTAREACLAVDAQAAVVMAATGPGADVLELLAHHGLPEGRMDSFQRLAVDAGYPICRAFTTGQPEWLTELEYRARYGPVANTVLDRLYTHHIASLPLVVEGKTVAAVGLSFGQGCEPCAEDRRFVEALIDLCAQAFERARRYDAERAGLLAAERLGVMLDAAQAIGRALEPEEALARLGDLLVPRLADWCVVDLVDDRGEITLTTISHRDPSKIALARDLRRRYAPDPDEDTGLFHVIRTGEPALVSEISDAFIDQVARSPEHASAIREVGFRSLVIVPLEGRSRILGTISLASTRAELRYDATDLRLAKKIAAHAALAIDNARLFAELRARADAERAAKREAEAANRLKDEFLETASHELRTPLSAILGWATLLREGRVEAGAADRALAAIERNARAQARLVDDVLDVSRILSGKLAIRCERVDLAGVLSQALDVVRPSALAKGVPLHAEIAGALPCVMGDADRLQQVAWNLLSNAVKFTPRGGSVTLRAAARDGSVVVDVTDTGKGIRPDFLPYLFDAFRQEDGSSTRAHGGLGLGLSIARHLVHLHGGEITAASDGEGHGAQLTFSLPAATTADAPNGCDHGAWTPPRLDGVRVLVVDDDADSRQLAAAVLERQGARVTVAADAAEGLARLLEDAHDVLVSDIAMPGENGLTFLPRAREAAGTRLPALAFTAYADAEHALLVQQAGFDGLLTKPIPPDDLIERVRALAGMSQRPRAATRRSKERNNKKMK